MEMRVWRLLIWLLSYLGPLFSHPGFRNGEVYAVNLDVYGVLFFEHDYRIGLISEESDFGTFLGLL